MALFSVSYACSNAANTEQVPGDATKHRRRALNGVAMCADGRSPVAQACYISSRDESRLPILFISHDRIEVDHLATLAVTIG